MMLLNIPLLGRHVKKLFSQIHVHHINNMFLPKESISILIVLCLFIITTIKKATNISKTDFSGLAEWTDYILRGEVAEQTIVMNLKEGTCCLWDLNKTMWNFNPVRQSSTDTKERSEMA